ncbi:MAG: hypothetical protein A2Y12_20555 [Planctomycetes bacterium GWF2_42_9]|nr:MAG: hypothetical protein A2Y12_20555 [Planctomycetes bacterium GWF2_42_9]
MDTLLQNAPKIDFDTHNRNVKELWSQYSAGTHKRIPMILGMNPRMYLMDPKWNTENITFDQYMQDPAAMADVQLKYQYIHRHIMMQDKEMGLPTDGWTLYGDGQNVWEFEWLGAEPYYPADHEPYVVPFITNENKFDYLKKPVPKTFEGVGARMLEYYNFFKKMKDSGYTFKGKPIGEIGIPGTWCDGPFTLAFGLMGEQILMDMLSDRPFYDALMDKITTACINRVKAFRKEFGIADEPQICCMADDSICLLSTQQYKEFVLPYQKRFVDECGTPGKTNYMHLCGDASRHFAAIRDELNVFAFDTGFPIDFKKIRDELGEKVEIAGGVHVELLLNGKPQDIYDETKRILLSGIKNGGKFILRDANNLSPCTPPENIRAMYKANLDFGTLIN